MLVRNYISVFCLAILGLFSHTALAASIECVNWQVAHPEWIWCDDFESDTGLNGSYFEVDRAGGRFGVSGERIFAGTGALRSNYAVGQESAGGLKLSFGRTPVSPQLAQDRDFSEIFWRIYISVSPGWVGNGSKTSRASVFASSGWTQAAVGMLWEDTTGGLGLGLDPVSGVTGSTVVTTRYNDQLAFKWLGHQSAQTQIYSPANNGKWFCVEARMRLNTPGQSDGLFTLWIDGQQEASATALNWRGSYTSYGINALFIENYINGGPPQTQSRYMDSFVVSTARIGCASDLKPRPPTSVNAQ